MKTTEPSRRGVAVPARLILPPRSISAQAQAFLAAAPERFDWPAYPDASDTAGWRVWIESINSRLAGPDVGAGLAAQLSCESQLIGGVRSYIATPRSLAPAEPARIFLDIHGGGFVIGGGEVCRIMGMSAALRFRARTYAPDYRMPPDHPYPAPLDDCLRVYRTLLESHAPERILVGGTSAGGNLAAALVLRARDEGLPMPAGLVLLTPEVDLTESGDSFQTNRLIDVVLRDSLAAPNALYAAGQDLAQPYLSPLFGDFAPGFPRTFLQAGTRDLFLSNAVRMHRALRRAGVAAELHIFEGMPHGGFFGAPEDEELTTELRRFAGECWGS